MLIVYTQDTTNPTLDHFQPFDLDAWWGRKLYQDLTSGLWPLEHPTGRRNRKLRREERVLRGRSIEEEKEEDEEEGDEEGKGSRWGKYLTNMRQMLEIFLTGEETQYWLVVRRFDSFPRAVTILFLLIPISHTWYLNTWAINYDKYNIRCAV